MALTQFAGIRNANQFAYGTALCDVAPLQVLQGSTSTGAYTILCSPAALKTSSGLSIPINTKTPIIIGSDSGIETVTPTAVSTNNLNQLLITATFTYAHGTGAQVRSGDYGLQEAAQSAATAGGGLVALDWAWFQANGLTTNAGLTTLLATFNSLSANVTLLNYGGISGALSYSAAAASAYASSGHVLY